MGTMPLVSTGDVHGPSLKTSLAAGSYYVEVTTISTEGELASSSLGVAVPEPATWMLALTGLFGMGAMLRRARSAKTASLVA